MFYFQDLDMIFFPIWSREIDQFPDQDPDLCLDSKIDPEPDLDQQKLFIIA